MSLTEIKGRKISNFLREGSSLLSILEMPPGINVNNLINKIKNICFSSKSIQIYSRNICNFMALARCVLDTYKSFFFSEIDSILWYLP